MSSLKEIKSRIASVKNTLKITSAMKMVASAKLHKAQAAIGGKLPYEQQLHHILAGLLQDNDLLKAMHDDLGFGSPDGHSAVVLQDVTLDQIPTKDIYPRIAIVAISSNSSLCGAFNANVIKKYQETIRILESQGYGKEDIDIYVIGRKMADAVRASGYDIKEERSVLADKPSYDAAADLLQCWWTVSFRAKPLRSCWSIVISLRRPHSRSYARITSRFLCMTLTGETNMTSR